MARPSVPLTDGDGDGEALEGEPEDRGHWRISLSLVARVDEALTKQEVRVVPEVRGVNLKK